MDFDELSWLVLLLSFFFFNDTATTEIYTLSLHDALPISRRSRRSARLPDRRSGRSELPFGSRRRAQFHPGPARRDQARSEEHTSELQSRQYLVCRLLLEKKKSRCNRSTASQMTSFMSTG